MFVKNTVAHANVTGAVSPAFVTQRGFTAALVRSGAGIYVLNLAEEVDANAAIIDVTRRASVHGSACATQLSDSQIEVRTFDNAGTAADVSFWITVDRTI